MQTATEIRRMLSGANLKPNKRLGQCFLIDGNLMGKLLELADVPPGATVLEVGPGTGSLTEELLARAGRVVAVEIDRGLAQLLRSRLAGRGNFALLEGDVLSGKHQIDPRVLAELGPAAHLAANLPYNIATPLVAECLLNSWRAVANEMSPKLRIRNPKEEPKAGGESEIPSPCRFERLTFTVQREVADRLTARPGGPAYGAVSVMAALLGRTKIGPAAPASAFWPPPKVASRMLRIDFDPAAAADLRDGQVLRAVLAAAFGQRRKQMGSAARKSSWAAFSPQAWREALGQAGIEPAARAEQVAPRRFLVLANALAVAGGPRGVH